MNRTRLQHRQLWRSHSSVGTIYSALRNHHCLFVIIWRELSKFQSITHGDNVSLALTLDNWMHIKCSTTEGKERHAYHAYTDKTRNYTSSPQGWLQGYQISPPRRLPCAVPCSHHCWLTAQAHTLTKQHYSPRSAAHWHCSKIFFGLLYPKAKKKSCVRAIHFARCRG